MTIARPYGTWTSSISASRVGNGEGTLAYPRVAGRTSFWIESHRETARSVLVRLDERGERSEPLPEWCSLRSTVHEDYGGSPYEVHGGVVYFVQSSDQRLYRFELSSGALRPLTLDGTIRVVDPVADPHRRRLICVGEVHSSSGEPVNLLVAVDDAAAGTPRPLVWGADFYGGARPSPDGAELAWTCWSHPHMPWVSCELWRATLNQDGSVAEPLLVAGRRGESAIQPQWSPDGALWFLSNRDGWWMPYRVADSGEVEAVASIEADHCRPPWNVGQRSIALLDADAAVAVARRDGVAHLGIVSRRDGWQFVGSACVDYGDLAADSTRAIVVGLEAARAGSILELEPSARSLRTLHHNGAFDVAPELISTPQVMRFPTSGGGTGHGYYYPPCNPAVVAPSDELPPCIVRAHGGPTNAASPTYNLTVQFFTSRGLGFLDVDYRGSTGFGRPYWESLYGQWGVVDVEDCICAARHLVERGLVDADRLIMRGASAGGFTTLHVLAASALFRAGIAYCAVTDLEQMERTSHKFESRYTSALTCGPGGDRLLLAARSPITAAASVKAPVLLVQGRDDHVVPMEQAVAMRDELERHNVPSALILLDDESHELRRAETHELVLGAELDFLGQVLGLTISEPTVRVQLTPALNSAAGEVDPGSRS